ncbi:RICIN domain-containing protein [Streptomyces goshikiensis]|uniref:RICIN domain-containing protein n=1 Tax=Streptomyces goshikiensis TaxID=1942 RepID=UPI0036BE8C1D
MKRRTTVRNIFTVAAIVGLAPSTGFSSAWAAPQDAWSEGPAAGSTAADRNDSYVNKFTLRCVDSSVNGLQALECNSLPFQSWTRSSSWSAYELRNRSTGLCLDDSAKFGLRAFPCNGTTFQAWNIYARDGGAVQITNLETGKCLDDSFASGLRSLGCNGQGFQRWYPRYGS